MLNRHNNIFFNLIKNETSLTEIFCNLMSYKIFRNHFVQFVKDNNEKFSVNIDEISFNDFQTEKDFGFDDNEEYKKVGRGDLVLEVDGKDYIFELKIETTTDLTNNQPYGYIKYLKNNNQTKDDLYFILPADYKHIFKLKDIDDTHIMYWEDLIYSLKTNGIIDIPYIKDFCNILEYRWFYYASINIRKVEINLIEIRGELNMDNRSVPHIMQKLFNIIDEIYEKYRGKVCQKNKYKDSFSYGFFIKNSDGEEILFFGIDYFVWEQTGNPLVIGLENINNKYLNDFKLIYNEENLKEIIYEGGANYIYLSLQNNEYLLEENVEKIKKKIDDVVFKIDLK